METIEQVWFKRWMDYAECETDGVAAEEWSGLFLISLKESEGFLGGIT